MTALLLVLLALGAVGVYLWRKRKRRLDLLASPLSDEERQSMARLVPLTKRLPPDLRAKLEGKINLFLDQVDFVGCNGFEVTDEVRLSIAAQACLLVMNTKAWYSRLFTILVYPSAFRTRQTSYDGFVAHEYDDVRLGESWTLGPVVLSWAHAQQGGINAEDGQNLVLHEFAHQLDSLSGATNGVPLLNRRQTFAQWEQVMLGAFSRHQTNTGDGRKTVIDAYGAQNHEEFFAVAIEVFFEKPEKLQSDEPDLYAELAKLLQLDPLKWGQTAK